METGFGTVLRDWRNERRLSQLALGLSANVSARHISFLESGRAKPSRSMVLQLCETLDVPRASRNVFLTAAGYAPVYRCRELAADDMAAVREAMEWTLSRHDPYPAFALDRHWTLVRTNAAAKVLLGAAGLAEGGSLLAALTDPELMTEFFENRDEVVRHMISRLRTESAHLGGDPELDAAADRLVEAFGAQSPHGEAPLPAVVPARYRAGGRVFSFFSTIAQFGTAEDIALAELKIEMLFPADEETRQVLAAMA